jgi:hypothetical protein
MIHGKPGQVGNPEKTLVKARFCVYNIPVASHSMTGGIGSSRTALEAK